MKKSIVIISIVVLLDQVFKIWVKMNMTLGEEIPILGDWFKLLFIENNGMAFGWLSGGGLKLALSLFRIVFVVFLFYFLYRLTRKKTNFGVIFGLSLVIAGALGNIIDSAFYGLIFGESTFFHTAAFLPEGGGYASFLHGRVVDMLYFPIIDVARTDAPAWLPDFLFGADNRFIFFRPIFNLADSAVTIGVLWLLLFERKFLKNI